MKYCLSKDFGCQLLLGFFLTVQSLLLSFLKDEDECADGKHSCTNSTLGGKCENTFLSYQCSCRSGFKGDGRDHEVEVMPGGLSGGGPARRRPGCLGKNS